MTAIHRTMASGSRRVACGGSWRSLARESERDRRRVLRPRQSRSAGTEGVDVARSGARDVFHVPGHHQVSLAPVRETTSRRDHARSRRGSLSPPSSRRSSGRGWRTATRWGSKRTSTASPAAGSPGRGCSAASGAAFTRRSRAWGHWSGRACWRPSSGRSRGSSAARARTRAGARPVARAGWSSRRVATACSWAARAGPPAVSAARSQPPETMAKGMRDRRHWGASPGPVSRCRCGAAPHGHYVQK